MAAPPDVPQLGAARHSEELSRSSELLRLQAPSGGGGEKPQVRSGPSKSAPQRTLDVSMRVRINLSVKGGDEAGEEPLGTVRFLGHTSFASGTWVGVELDVPSGKNDGSVQGVQYFSCAPRHGIFVRPAAVRVVADEPRPQLAASPTTLQLPSGPLPRAGAVGSADERAERSRNSRRLGFASGDTADGPGRAPRIRNSAQGGLDEEMDEMSSLTSMARVVSEHSQGLFNFMLQRTDKSSVSSSPYSGLGDIMGAGGGSALGPVPEGGGPGHYDTGLQEEEEGAQEQPELVRATSAMLQEGHELLKDMQAGLARALTPSGLHHRYAFDEESCTSDIIVPGEDMLEAFRQTARSAVEHGTRGLFKIVFEVHEALMEQTHNIHELQASMNRLRRELADRREEARSAAPRGSRRAAAPAAAATAMAAAGAPVEVPSAPSGAVPSSAPPASPNAAGGAGSPSGKALEAEARRGPAGGAATAGEWSYTIPTCRPIPDVEGGWQVWTGEAWEPCPMPPHTGEAGQRDFEPWRGPLPPPPPGQDANAPGTAELLAQHSAALQGCLERLAEHAASPSEELRGRNIGASRGAAFDTIGADFDLAGTKAVMDSAEVRNAIAIDVHAVQQEVYRESVRKLTAMYVRNLTDFASVRLHLDSFYRDAKAKALTQVRAEALMEAPLRDHQPDK